MKRSNFKIIPNKRTLISFLAISVILAAFGCSGNGNKENAGSDNSTAAPAAAATVTLADSLTDKGIGPVTAVTLADVIKDSADKGETLFKAKCAACHKLDSRLVGPALNGVTKRRTPEWIMNQIMNPAEQDTKDPLGNALLAKYMTQMTFQNVSQADARDILEYFRSNDASK
ncbi:MAG: cytochrome c [Bacteroidia bacterium]|nr:cytochrome c [Bacteroidia bacterium]